MATGKIEKIRDIEYDELSTINLIEKDEDLLKIFKEEVNISFNILRNLSIENKLSPKTKSFIKDLFDKIILTKINLINKYIYLANNNGKTIEVLKESKSILTGKQNKKKLPRRYGKSNLKIDIAKQGGKPNNKQLTALEINDLKNIYVNLNARLINDMFNDRQILNDEDYRDIRSTIVLLKNRLRKILKKK